MSLEKINEYLKLKAGQPDDGRDIVIISSEK